MKKFIHLLNKNACWLAFFAALLMAANECHAQTSFIGKTIEARQNLIIAGYTVNSISNTDTSFANRRSNVLPTEAVMKNFVASYVANHVGSGSGPGTETDPVWTTDKTSYRTKILNDLLYYPLSSNPSNYLISETDPVYSGSSWFSTTNNSSNWNTAFSWGNHASAGYLTASSITGKLNISDTASMLSAYRTAISSKEPAITAGTNLQYIRGDKSLATLDKAAVGLVNVDNTSDATKNAAAVTLSNKTIAGAVLTNSVTLPNVTTAQMNALTATPGMVVFNTDEDQMYHYDVTWGWESSELSFRKLWGNEYFNDFFSSTPADGFFVGSGTTAPTSTTGTSTRPGLLLFSTGNSATGRSTLANATANTILALGNGKVIFETEVQIVTLSSSTESFAFLTGLLASVATSATQTNGVFFSYDSTGSGTGSAAISRWQVATAAAGTRSFTTTGVQVVAGQWYKLKAIVNANATQVDFYIDNVLVKSETNNIPTAAVGNGINLFKIAGTTARTANVDWYYFKQKFASAR